MVTKHKIRVPMELGVWCTSCGKNSAVTMDAETEDNVLVAIVAARCADCLAEGK